MIAINNGLCVKMQSELFSTRAQYFVVFRNTLSGISDQFSFSKWLREE